MRHILLAVTGMSPQVVTETLYAIHCKGGPMPDEIYLITTETGKNQAWLTLGVGNAQHPAKLRQFCVDYGYPEIHFSQAHIWVVQGANGQPLADVTSDEEHRAMADFITAKVAQLTQDPAVTLHASLAGGRKTMTFFLGYAMSLYAREQDCLSHVLVTEGYERSSEFFYPTPYDSPIRTSSGKVLNARHAEVNLATIPFVRMRQEVPESLLSGNSSYSGVVDALNKIRQEPRLVVSTKTKTIVCDDVAIKLPPKRFALYRWLAWRAQQNKEGIPTPTELGDDTYLEEILAHYEAVTDEFRADEQRHGPLQNGYTKTSFEQYKSKINREIRNCLGESWGKKFMIEHIATSAGRKRYGIAVNPQHISIE